MNRDFHIASLRSRLPIRSPSRALSQCYGIDRFHKFPSNPRQNKWVLLLVNEIEPLCFQNTSFSSHRTILFYKYFSFFSLVQMIAILLAPLPVSIWPSNFWHEYRNRNVHWFFHLDFLCTSVHIHICFVSKNFIIVITQFRITMATNCRALVDCIFTSRQT
jgi:hypothetical protein